MPCFQGLCVTVYVGILFWNNYRCTESCKDSTREGPCTLMQFLPVASYIITAQWQARPLTLAERLCAVWCRFISYRFIVVSEIKVQDHFTTTKIYRRLYSHSWYTSPPVPSLSKPWPPLISHVYNSVISRRLNKWTHSLCDLLRLFFSPLRNHNALKNHPSYCTYH